VFVPATDAFRSRLLELVPIYYEAGREIARLDWPEPGPSATDLAAVACRRWLLETVPGHAEAMLPVAVDLAAARSAETLVDFARDVVALAGPLGDENLAATARHAEAAARAAAAGDAAAAGRAAADCLYSRRGERTDYIVAEARALTTAAGPRTGGRS
jgi:hypothetical protein